jgi:hypothetical protein
MNKESILKLIQKEVYGVTTVERRGNDSLDFHDVHISSLVSLVEKAFVAGKLDNAPHELTPSQEGMIMCVFDDLATTYSMIKEMNWASHVFSGNNSGTAKEFLDLEGELLSTIQEMRTIFPFVKDLEYDIIDLSSN